MSAPAEQYEDLLLVLPDYVLTWGYGISSVLLAAFEDFPALEPGPALSLLPVILTETFCVVYDVVMLLFCRRWLREYYKQALCMGHPACSWMCPAQQGEREKSTRELEAGEREEGIELEVNGGLRDNKRVPGTKSVNKDVATEATR